MLARRGRAGRRARVPRGHTDLPWWELERVRGGPRADRRERRGRRDRGGQRRSRPVLELRPAVLQRGGHDPQRRRGRARLGRAHLQSRARRRREHRHVDHVHRRLVRDDAADRRRHRDAVDADSHQQRRRRGRPRRWRAGARRARAELSGRVGRQHGRRHDLAPRSGDGPGDRPLRHGAAGLREPRAPRNRVLQLEQHRQLPVAHGGRPELRLLHREPRLRKPGDGHEDRGAARALYRPQRQRPHRQHLGPQRQRPHRHGGPERVLRGRRRVHPLDGPGGVQQWRPAGADGRHRAARRRGG